MYTSFNRPKAPSKFDTSQADIDAFYERQRQIKAGEKITPAKPVSCAIATAKTSKAKKIKADRYASERTLNNRLRFINALKKHGEMTTQQVIDLVGITNPHQMATTLNSYNQRTKGRAVIAIAEVPYGKLRKSRTFRLIDANDDVQVGLDDRVIKGAK